MNGDGFDDYLIGAPGDDNGSLLSTGKAFLNFGGPGPWINGINISTSAVTFVGEASGDIAGSTVAGLGDINGDGLADFAIAAPHHRGGTVYIFFGHMGLWPSIIYLAQANASFVGEGSIGDAGDVVAAAGDVNGDRLSDILITAPGYGSGKAYLVFGKTTGWARGVSLANADASFVAESPGDGTPLGMDPHMGAGSAGDVNGDGFDDILIGVPGNDSGGYDTGQTYLILGRPGGLYRNMGLGKADASFIGSWAEDRSGWAATTANDVNGDGYDDFLISAPWNYSSGDRAGVVYLFFGGVNRWGLRSSVKNADVTIKGAKAYDRAGFSLSAGGDVNGDGLADFIVGAHTSGSQPEAGRVYVIFGRRTWSSTDSFANANLTYGGEVTQGWAGYSVSGAGDFNNDGHCDFIIGSPFYDNPQTPLDAGKTYVVFGPPNGPPGLASNISFFKGGYSTPATTADLGGDTYAEFRAADGNPTTVDTAKLRLFSSVRHPAGIPINLLETGPNTGIYRGRFSVKDTSQASHRWIGAGPGETITLTTRGSAPTWASLAVAYNPAYGLPQFPNPFVVGGALNATLALGLSQPHYPATADNTIDAVAAIVLGMRLGRASASGNLKVALDIEVATTYGDKIVCAGGSNLISVGGEGVNLVTRAFNMTMPVISSRGTIRVVPSGSRYRAQGSYFMGTSVTDYAYIALAYDGVNRRFILTIAGLSGFATRKAAQLLAEGSLPLAGQALVLRLQDTQGDGIYESFDVAEVVWSERSFNGTSTYSPSPPRLGTDVSSYTFPQALVKGGTLNVALVVALSQVHGPAGAANTIDVVGGVSVGFRLGRATTSGPFIALLDLEAAHYDASGNVYIDWAGNLLAFGGRNVNLVTRYYNATLPVRQEKAKGICVVAANGSLGNCYLKVGDYFLGQPVTDYGYYAGTYDERRGAWAFVVAGASGFATRQSASYLAGRVFPMDSPGAVLKQSDANGDGFPEAVDTIATAGGPATLADFPYPFRDRGVLNGTVVIALSQPHPPETADNTIDAVGGVLVAMSLGRFSVSGQLQAKLDTDVAYYDGVRIHIVDGTNLLAFGGPGVNFVTRAYNITTSVGSIGYNGHPSVGVFGTQHFYVKSGDYFQGTAVQDFAYVALVYDASAQRYVVIIAGLSGFATRKAAEIVATRALPLAGSGVVMRLNDTNGDGVYESTDVVEVTGPRYNGQNFSSLPAKLPSGEGTPPATTISTSYSNSTSISGPVSTLQRVSWSTYNGYNANSAVPGTYTWNNVSVTKSVMITRNVKTNYTLMVSGDGWTNTTTTSTTITNLTVLTRTYTNTTIIVKKISRTSFHADRWVNTTLLWDNTTTITTYTNVTTITALSPLRLSNFPYPYVDRGLLNVTVVLAASSPHGGISGANTIDVVGSVLLGARLGRASTRGAFRAVLDIEVTSPSGAQVTGGGNLITVGGRNVNLVTRYYNATLPVRQEKAKGICVVAANGSLGNCYLKVGDYFLGQPVTDYGYVAFTFDPAMNRYVLAIVGASGFATREVNIIVALGLLPLSGKGEIFQLYDAQGDGVYESISVIAQA